MKKVLVLLVVIAAIAASCASGVQKNSTNDTIQKDSTTVVTDSVK